MKTPTKIHALIIMILKRQKINTKNGFRKLNSKHFISKQWDMRTILWPNQLVLDANLFGFPEIPLLY